MNIAGLSFENLNDSARLQTVALIGECYHACLGCCNEKANDPRGGTPFTIELQEMIVRYMRENNLATGITVCGGDPLYHADELVHFLRRFKRELPKQDIWVYTGFLFEEVRDLPVMRYIDVLVDGKFAQGNRNVALPFKGSSNQRIIDVARSRELDAVCLYAD